MIFNFYDYIPSKKNSKEIITNKKTGRMTLIPSVQFFEWEKIIKATYEKTTILEGNENGLEYYKGKENLYLTIIFYKRGDGHSFDLTNAIQSIEDTFKLLGIIDDDKNTILSNFTYKYIDSKRADKKCCVLSLSEEESSISKLLLKEKNIKEEIKRPEEYDTLRKKRVKRKRKKDIIKEINRNLDI